MALAPVVFPLFPIVDGVCGCSNEGCSRIGKHPAVLWRDLAYGDPVPRPEPGAGVGLKTGAAPKGSGVFVVDLDGGDAFTAWAELGGGEGAAVPTPRGAHLYFEHPGVYVKNSRSALAPGIDIRGDGGFVVAPGSPHRSGTYGAMEGELGPAPDWLLEWLKGQAGPAEIAHYSGDVEGEERDRRVALYREYLADAPPSVAGQGGDEQLFAVVQRGAYDFALPVEDVLSAIEEVFDPRCDPPWGDELEERVLHKANDAKTTSTRPAMPPLPADLAHLAKAQKSILETYADTFRKLAESPTGDIPTSQRSETSAPQKGPIVWGGWDTPIEPPVYLLEGLIPEGKVCTFFAEGGSLKTWAAFSLAISVAKGEPWLGTFPVQQGKALYLDYEDGRYEFQRRIRILQGLQDIPDLGYWQYPPPLESRELWEVLAPLKLRLIVVDALSSGVSSDVDENDRKFSEAVKIAGRYTAEGCTVVFVHHANKTGSMRGSSTVRDQSDVVFKFDPVSETDSTKRMRMVCDKPGPQKKPKPVNVELSDSGLRTFEDEANDIARNALNKKDLEAAILLAVRDAPLVRTRIQEVVRGNADALRAKIKILVDEGKLRELGANKGYVCDDVDSRRARVLARARTYHGSVAGLAGAADVPTDEVKEMIKESLVLRSGTGFIVP